jgi:uncharacterized protein Smg (DUF494 family)
MNERVVEILILIMSEIKQSRDGAKNLEVLSKDLIQRGYTENEISSAFSWLLNRLNSESEELIQNQGPTSDRSFRLLHEIERSIIATEAFGYIIQLKELGIIDEVEVEQVLERAMMLGTSQVNVADIKSIVASILFNPENFKDSIYFLFEENPVIH